MNGKRGKKSTVTEDQHGMTEGTPDTQTREVSHPSRTPGNYSVLSEPRRTIQTEQLDGPLRNTSTSNTQQLKQSKQLSGPKRSSKEPSVLDRRYYKPTNVAKTYYLNSQGHLQSREDPPEIIKPNGKGKLPDSKEHPIYHEPGSIVINGTEEL